MKRLKTTKAYPCFRSKPARLGLWLRSALLVTCLSTSSSLWAMVCEAPSALTGVPKNSYFQGEGTASAGSLTITIGSQRISNVESSTTDTSNGISPGDTVFIIQMQDASINNSNDDSYGDGTSGDDEGKGYTALNSTGLYEFATVESVSGSTLTLTEALQNTYRSAGATGSTGRRTFQVIRVSRFNDLDLSGTGTVTDWNGRTGGVYVIDVVDTLTVTGSTTIDASEAGFRGGGAFNINPITIGATVDDFALTVDQTNTITNLGAYKGEGIAGTPSLVRGFGAASGGFNAVDANLTSSDQGFAGDQGYPNSLQGARGAPGNAGGGGDEHNAGGGGGSNFGSGGNGGATFGWYEASPPPGNGRTDCQEYVAESTPGAADGFYACDGDGSRPVGGEAGGTLSTATIFDYESRLFMGGGGGAGAINNSTDNNGVAQSSGGNGGGIVVIRTLNLVQSAGTLNLIANGGAGQDTGRDGAGGGGAGGSLLLLANSGSYSFVTMQASGGAGGKTGLPLRGGETQGPGGGGGGGAALVASSANIGTITTSGGAPGENEPFSGILNPIGAETGAGNSVKVAYDPTNISSGGQCGLDFGDAPAADGYPDASHTLIRPIFMGAAIPDGEDMTLSDDNSVADVDEDGLISAPALTTADATYSVDVQVTNNVGVGATLFGWLDFDGDGNFEDGASNEATTVAVANGSTGSTVQLTWTVPGGIAVGDTYLRLRLTSDSSISTATPSLAANDGEVEDHPITIFAGGSACTYPTADAVYNLNGDVTDSGAAVSPHDPTVTLAPGDFSSIAYVSGSSGAFFDGTDQVNLNDTGTASFMNTAFDQMSVTMWLKPSGFTGIQDIWDEGGGSQGAGIRLNGTELQAIIQDEEIIPGNLGGGGDGVWNLAATFPQDGEWHHIGLTFNSSGVDASTALASLYIDGVLVDSESWTTAVGVTDLEVDAHGNEHGLGLTEGDNAFENVGNGYTGYLDQLVYWVDDAVGGVAGNADISADMATLATCDVPVIRRDFGDAPDTSATASTGNYSTELSNNGPRHLLSSNLYLGAVEADDDSDAVANTGADGDDTEGGQPNNDEGVEQLLTSGSVLTPIITTDTSYSITIDVANSTGSNANLFAWIDFDFSGTFDDTEVATATVADNDTTATLTWSSLSGLTIGNSYLRLRLTSDALADTGGTEDTRSLGEATDGEVEDYALSILPPPDFGDAPLINYGAAFHDISGAVNLFMGVNAGDGEDATLEGGDAGVGADGDDNDATDDEDALDGGIADLNIADTSYSITVPVTNTGATAELAAWLDFDISGTFEEDEFATVTVNNGDTSAVLNWTNIGSTGPDINFGDSYLRLRLTRDTDVASGVAATSSAVGGADDGEVEDHLIRIYGSDFGDAPSAYQNASHQILSSPTLYLGDSQPDEEATSQYEADDGEDADGDDNDGNDDESAIASFDAISDSATLYGTTYNVSVSVTNTGAAATLYGWIDFDDSNSFDEDEVATASVTATGTTVLAFTVPTDTQLGVQYARFRLTTDTLTFENDGGVDERAGEAATDGEVEDFPFSIADSTALYFEAECSIAGNNWTANSTTQASESVYLQSAAATRNNTLTGLQPAADLLQFDFNLPGTGTFDVYARVNFANTSSNSFQLSTDNSTWVDKDDFTTSSAWAWVSTAQQITGTAGDPISLFIAYQETNSLIDKFAVIPNGSPGPTGLGDDVGSCFDFGDAPDPSGGNNATDFTTSLANFGPIHPVDGAGNLYIGTQAADTEIDSLSNSTATGDDSTDETEAQLLASNGGQFPLLNTSDTSYGFTVDVFNNKGSNAFLFAWVDWDRDGLFEETELDAAAPYTIADSGSGQTQALNWTGLSPTTGNYAVRLRLSTDTQLVAGADGGEDEASVDVVIDGEVEDHFITAFELDYGDAPVATAGDYDDTNADGSVDGSDSPASHGIVSGINLGGDPDADTGVWANGVDDSDVGSGGDATDDDTEGTDDEGGISVFPALVDADTSYALTLSVNNGDASNAASVFAWIDFNSDGAFEESERATLSAGTVAPSGLTIPASSSGTVSLDWSGLSGLVVGDTYIRVRITTDTGLVAGIDGGEDEASTGFATDGEVEDYQLTIASVRDYGDAPIIYGEASHVVQANIEIGLLNDIDDGTQLGGDAGVGADGDDSDGTDDEDGTTPGALSSADTSYSLSVNVDNSSGVNGTLFGWIDLDLDNSFDHDERASVAVDDGTSGSVSLNWSGIIPSIGTTYIRLRLTTDDLTTGESDEGSNQDDVSIGSATNGEVEDYELIITDGSQVFFEAECGVIGNDWITGSRADASENVYVETVQNSTTLIDDPRPPNELLVYQVTVPLAGTYDLYTLVDAPGGGDDSFFYTLDNLNNDTWYVMNTLPTPTTGFDWIDVEAENGGGAAFPQVVTTTTNEVVTIYIRWRENGILIDKFALLPNDTDPATISGQGETVGSCFDFGDAPDTNLDTTGAGDYISLIGNSTPGPIHPVDNAPAVFLGSSAPDTENDALQSTNADGDDGADEGEAQLISTAGGDAFPALTTADTSFSYEIDVTNNKAVDATIVAWVDFDQDGVFEAGEQSDTNPTVAQSSGSTQATLTWSGLSGVSSGNTVTRIRVSTATNLTTRGSTDVVIDGEVEDHQITIFDVDYGDAPVTTNGDYDDTNADGSVNSSDDPARHLIVAGINLGTDPDADTNVWGDGVDDSDNATDDDTPGDPAGGTDDEDGTTIAALSTVDTTYDLTLSVNNGDASNAANVFAWVDFDGSGSFDEDERASVTGGVSSGGQVPASTSGSVTLNWASIPVDVQSGSTYARIRITTDSGLVAGSDGGEDEASLGLATNGEVEDYQVVISGVDFGDAPATYLDAQHNFVPAQEFFIGSVIPDGESGTQLGGDAGVGADGDDASGSDDEEADPTITGLSTVSTGTYNLSVAITNISAPATLVGWIDFDGNGTFEADEASTIVADNASATGNVNLAFDLDSLVDPIDSGTTYARFRITRQTITTADFSGSLSDGEVEDYSLFIAGTDFGDAPVAYDNTAQHAIDGENIRLGSVAPDNDSGFWGDGIDNTLIAADDDTLNDPTGGVDDEDGINTATIPVLSSGADTYSVSLGLRNENTGSTAANVYAWIDFDGNNSFDEDERATLSAGTITPTTEGDPSDLSVPSAALTGSVDLDWTGIQAAGITAGTTYMRVRITTDDLDLVADGGSQDDASVGAATDGEIEDYQITIVANIDYGDAPVTANNNYDDTTGDGLVNGSDDPARHNIVSGILLGSAIDADSLTWGNGSDGNGNATDDDVEGSAPDDDDGVTGAISIPVDQSAQYDLTVNATSSSSANIYGWIDFDQSGTFDEDERTSTTRGAGTGDVTLSWTSFPGLSLGTTYARIRITSVDLTSGESTDGSAEDDISTGLAADGEVEDYSVSVTGMDFGDVPVVSNGDYDDTNSDGSVTSADNAAEHAIDLALYLGDTVPDSEAPGQNTNGDATDDETNGSADEGISQLLTSGSTFPTLLPTTTSYSLTVDLTNSTGSSANAYAWIDFDNDEEFDEDERATASAPNGATSATFNWSNIGGSGPDIVSGNTYLRVRLTTDNLDISTESSGVEDDASLGTATDGEVEDYSIAIGNFDYGDAPDLGAGQGTGDYRTLAVDDGASHTISPTIYLGSTAPDLDSNGFEEGTDNSDVGSGGNATDDDSNGGDEGLAQLLTSGSSFPALASGDASYSLEVDMSNTSGGPVNVIAWVDFDQSGTFDEDEVAVNTLLGALSSTTLNWASIPNDISDGTTYVRFRITSNPLTSNDGSGEDERSYGNFSNGEVEDYQITISGTDFGDAPSIYGSFDSGGGAKHEIISTLYLGDTLPDGEGDAFGDGNDTNGNATDDDIEGSAADEGIAQLLNSGTAFPVYDVTQTSYSLTVDVFNDTGSTANVYAWIDWDIDGKFDNDEIASTTASSTGVLATATLTWPARELSDSGGNDTNTSNGIPNVVVGSTYMRFRVTTDDLSTIVGDDEDQHSGSIGGATNGEVEDYSFTIEGDINISGNIFEDINYGGGNGRNRTAALADGGSNFGALTDVVELWDFDGSTCTGLATGVTENRVDTNSSGEYTFAGVPSPATYCVRVVTTTLASTRTSTGAGNTEVAVQTFRSQSTDGNGTVAQIIAEIGGRYPQDVDSAAATFDSISGDGTATHSWSQVITGATDIADLDFGFNFNTVVNTNDGGQGSLRQFMLNAEELSNTGLAQQTQTAGVDVSIFAIPTTDTGYNATGQGEYTISVTSALPTISQEPIHLDGSTQSGVSCPTPKIEIADNATGGDGIQITSGSSLVRGFIINGFESGSGINLNSSGSNTISCNYVGTNASGGDTGNGGNGTGVSISSTATSNTIGGSAAAQNLISANIQNGLSLSSNSNTVTTNIIGLAVDGLTTLGNGDSGILINAASNNIGSTSSGDANTIAGNGAAGITISPSASNTANAIFINAIFNNGDTGGAASARTLGIDLGGDGETANDGATDSDTGANTLINAPVLGSIVMGGAADTMDIPVTLALPDGTYRVEFYANAVCNALQTGIEDSAATSGEGQDFTGSQSIIITGGVADVTTVNLSTLGVVGSEMTAKVIDASGNTSEFSDCQAIPTGVVPAATITGTVFEDVNYGGGFGRDYATANAAYFPGTVNVGTQSTVELWASDGNNCTGGSPLQAVTSNPTTGAYSFNTVNDTLFCVRIVNSTVQSNRTGWNSSLVPVQTYRSNATQPTRVVGGQSPRDVDSAAGVYDAITGDGFATQSFSIVDVSGGNVTGVDFGFNFSTIVNTNSSGQGSLGQFVENANTLGANTADKSGLTQENQSIGRETSIFMVSNGAELDGLSSSIPNLLSGNSVAEITLTSDLVVTADNIILDGSTQTDNVGGNAATLGTGGTVGTQALAMGTLNGPEVQLENGGIDIRSNLVEVRGFAMLPTSSAITINNGALTGHVIEQNVVGASAISFSEPGSGSSADLISIASATGNGTSGAPGALGLIQNNLIGFGSGDGIALSSNATGWTITNNELQGFSGDAAISLGAGVSNTNIRGNLIATSTYGIELNNSSGSNAADSIDENTIQANISGGILIPATATSDGGNSITQNIVSGNTGPGVIVLTSQTNLISENSIFNNDGLGIDLGNDGVTNGVESGSAANEFLNIPDVTMADASDGTNLDITGTYTSTQAATPVTIEIYSSSTCNPNSSGVAEGTDFGEGESFEGSTTVSGGNFNLSVLLSNLGVRRFITAIARDNDGNTSEFSQCEVGLTSDYGDAPNSYFTSEASGGPSHIRDSQIFIGTGVGGDGGVGVPDIESDAAVSADATGDDSAGSDDEDGIDPSTDFAFLTSASDSFNLTVDVYNNSGATANLVGWIDYDDSGTFDNDEVATVEVTSSTATGRTATLNWSSIPLDVLDGVTFARLRFTTDTSIATGTASTSSPIGPALDGEVEDYQITIAEGRDYGDAPDSYETLIASGGPSHVRNLQIYMGSVPPDGEFDGVPAAADGDPVGDDNNGAQDDEDGVVLPGIVDSDTSYSVSVDVINTTGNDVTLHAWFDVNRDGNFGTGGVVDATEYTSVTLTGSTGSINDVALTWSSLNQPSVTGADFTYIRIRLTPTSEGLGSGDWGGNGPDGSADGEVEDYRITVAEFNCNSLYVHTAANSVLTGNFNRVQLYNPSGSVGNTLTDVITTTGSSAGTALDGITRRYYWNDRNTADSILYDDGSGAVDTGTDITPNANWNRSAFDPDGVLWVLESGIDAGDLAAYSAAGVEDTSIGDTILNDASNGTNVTGTTGGDIAFDLDGNLYILSYNGGATEYYVYRILADDLRDSNNPTAVQIQETTGISGQTAGAAFFTSNDLYLFDTDGDVFAWDLNTSSPVQVTDAANGGSNFGVVDAASCIFPTLRPSLIVEKRVFNDTDSGSPGFTPGDTLRYRITVENVGAFFADSTTFVDQIPVNSTYVQNSTTLNGNPVSDNGGQMPYETATSINSPSGATGEIESGETATIEFQVLVDNGTAFTQVCNDSSIVEYTNVANALNGQLTIQQATDDPTTPASPTFPAVGGVTDDPTCVDKVSGYAISGTVYEDLNVDGLDDGSGAGENGISGVEIVLRDETAGTCQSVSTDVNGDYSFGPLDGGNYTLYEANGVATPTPAACPPTTADPTGFNSSTSQTIAVLVTNANIENQDFGDVQGPNFSPNNTGVVLPTSSIFYAHTFAPKSEGSVIFSFSETTTPLNNGWSVTLYEDTACNGSFDVGDNVISNAITVTLTANVPDDICILTRVTAPADVTAGDEQVATVTATFTYGDGSAGIADEVISVTDTTTTLSSGDGTMVLAKTVENITATSDFFDNGVPGTSNDAAPGDELRYVITFQNISTSAINTIDIFDLVPSFTVLSSDLLLNCFTDTARNDFSNTSVTDCQIANPTGSGLIGHPQGYDGDLQWDLTGSLGPGESGSVSFTVEVE